VERAPPLLPVVGDRNDRRVRELLRDLLDERGELERTAGGALFESFRKALEPQCAPLLGPLERDANRNALQRNALLSLSKKLSSAL
jgi:hypothetical protein